MKTRQERSYLSRCELESLRLLTRWMVANKQTADYSPIWGSTGPDGEYGIWRWQSERVELSWTELPRGVLVEFQHKGDAEAYGFVWNKLLLEFNDALLPNRMGRGYFQYMLGIPMPKSENDICRQNLRVNLKIFNRQCCRFLRRMTPGGALRPQLRQ